MRKLRKSAKNPKLGAAALIFLSAFVLFYSISLIGTFYVTDSTNAHKSTVNIEEVIPSLSLKTSKKADVREKTAATEPDAVTVSANESDETKDTNDAVQSALPADTASIPTETVIPTETIISGYRNVSLYDTSSGSTATLSLEDYVTGALLAEMPTSYSAEALKAQAIACRTYAVYKLSNGAYHEGGAGLCTSPSHCQAFADKSSVSEERYAVAKNAAEATKGVIMCHNGAPILAVFHASSGKKTDSSAEVWGGELSYLASVETWESENPSMDVKKQYAFSPQEFSSKLKSIEPSLSAFDDAAVLSDISLTKADSGRVISVNVCGTPLGGSDIVNSFGLRSADFELSVGENVVITTSGYGHGVGLSQYGAEDLAQKGRTCYEILMHYYTGITFGMAE